MNGDVELAGGRSTDGLGDCGGFGRGMEVRGEGMVFRDEAD